MDIRLEKRLSPRRNTSMAALIAFAGRKEMCIVRNVSETGAKLEIHTTVASIPNSFELFVPKHLPQLCRVVWRAPREMGVQFID